MGGGLDTSYVRDGLILWFDAVLEQEGEVPEVHNWAGGPSWVHGGTIVNEGGVLVNKGDYIRFNPDFEDINGYPAYSAGYSAEMCVDTAGAKTVTANFLAKVLHPGTTAYYPCFQAIKAEDGKYVFRCQERADNNSSLMRINLGAGSYSAYCQLGGLGMGGTMSTLRYYAGAAGVGTLAMTSGVRLHSFRLYNRQLDADEQAHNWELDRARFNLAVPAPVV